MSEFRVNGTQPSSQPIYMRAAHRVIPKTRTGWIRVALAAALITVSLLTNRQFLGWGLLAVFAILIVPVGRIRSLLVAFIPYTTVWFVFTFLRSFADETFLATILNTKVAMTERWVFNGELPTISLQASWYDPYNLRWYDYYLVFIHWSYFVVPHAVAVWLWWQQPARFRHYLAAMTLLLTIGLAIYFLIPSNPPWMAPESVNSPAAATTMRVMEPVAKSLGGGLYEAGYRIVGESNPIAAMPSIHMAITFLIPWAVRERGRVWLTLALFYSFSMGLALVYLGEHYVVDVVAGCLITSYSWYAAGAWLKRFSSSVVSHRAANAVPTTPPHSSPA